MGFLTKFKNRLELNKAIEQNRAFTEKYGNDKTTSSIPLLYTGAIKERKVVREIKGTLTGKTVAYETEDGAWIEAGTDHHIKQGKSFITIKSPATEEFEAMQTLSFPYSASCGS